MKESIGQARTESATPPQNAAEVTGLREQNGDNDDEDGEEEDEAAAAAAARDAPSG